MGTTPWLVPGDGGVARLAVYVQPGAKRTEIVGEYDGCLRIRLAAPPVDGKANAALCAFVAKRLGLSPGAVDIAVGHASRWKRLRLSNAPENAGARLLGDG